jgi:hypothetical protein
MVIVAVPFFLLVLGIIQLILLQAAKLGTMRAADAAVRAAVVILDDDPRRYGGAARNSAGPGSQRMRDIEMAAAIALVPFDPPVARLLPTVATALATPLPAEPMPGLMTPLPATLGKLRVTFPSGGGSFGLHARVTVRVEFDFDCLVPLARRVVCVGGTRKLLAESTLTNQGAPYTY